MIKIAGYILDAALTDEPTYDAEVTKYPVEKGSDLTDYTRNLPVALSIEFVVSDTPIGEVAKARQGAAVPSSEAKGFLLALRAGKEPFTVETDSGVYDDMIFTSLSFPRNEKTGACLSGVATLERIEIAQVRRTIVRSLGQRTSRSTKKQKTMWLCPKGTAEAPGNDAFNAGQGCRRVIFINGAPHFEDTGEPLTIGQISDLNTQTLDDNEYALKFDPEAWNDANKKGQWVVSAPEVPGMVPKKYPAFPNVQGQDGRRDPFQLEMDEVYDDTRTTNGWDGTKSLFR